MAPYSHFKLPALSNAIRCFHFQSYYCSNCFVSFFPLSKRLLFANSSVCRFTIFRQRALPAIFYSLFVSTRIGLCVVRHFSPTRHPICIPRLSRNFDFECFRHILFRARSPIFCRLRSLTQMVNTLSVRTLSLNELSAFITSWRVCSLSDTTDTFDFRSPRPSSCFSFARFTRNRLCITYYYYLHILDHLFISYFFFLLVFSFFFLILASPELIVVDVWNFVFEAISLSLSPLHTLFLCLCFADSN